ncbi:MAG: hypothetical protein IJA86_03155 [Clostridia bacterium]|nr:hypothetical protein [Clostridia bacterium]
MNRFCKALACFTACLFLVSCVPETDFIIPEKKTEYSESEREEIKGIFVVINKNTFKYHLDPDCVYATNIASENRLEITVPDLGYLAKRGYSRCSYCAGDQ